MFCQIDSAFNANTKSLSFRKETDLCRTLHLLRLRPYGIWRRVIS